MMHWNPGGLRSSCARGVHTREKALITHEPIFHPVVSRHGMVATQQYYATQAGLEVLKQGGNAVDAAVTVGFTLAVTLPRAGNLGGGGFMLIHLAKNKETVAVDYREKAPEAATQDMFLDKDGAVDEEKSRYSYLAIRVPGTVAGLTAVLEKYGTISLERALRPAIRLAEEGFPIDEEFAQSLVQVKSRMEVMSASMAVFYKESGIPFEPGEILVQKDLAWSLRQIGSHGRDAFYKGDLAKRLVADIKAHGGLITMEDLNTYEPMIRKPVIGSYRGYKIYSMPPPSSGGVYLIQILNILEGFPIGEMGHNRAETVHLMVEAMKLVYADRFKHLGDPDFVSVPIEGLLSKGYAEELRDKIRRDKVTPSSAIIPGDPYRFQEGNDTTHFTVMDRVGNVVANTYTLNFSYGTKFVAAGTGILLNNEMDDFTAKPGVVDTSNFIGGEKNAIEPEKRMLSSMTPTIVMKDGKPFFATGSPGGSRIVTATLQVIMNVIDHGMNIAEATNAFRIHHQLFPDEIRVERGMNGDTIELLKTKGHKIQFGDAMGSTQSIMFKDGIFYGASDPRRPGALTLGY